MIGHLEISLTGGPACSSQQGMLLGKSVKVSEKFDCGSTTLTTEMGDEMVVSMTRIEPSGDTINIHTAASHPHPIRVMILSLMVPLCYAHRHSIPYGKL